MAQRFREFLVLSIAMAAFGQAQPNRVKTTEVGADAQVSTNIHLGDSVVALYGPWKFQIGDSPIDPTTKQPLWAETDFDDSKWEAVDLTPKTGSRDPWAGISGYVPGWTAKGHPNYWGYAWYRIRVRVEAKPGVKLALEGPSNVDDVYQVFVAGRLVGSFGDFSASRPVAYNTQPMTFHLPQPASDSADGSIEVLAFRIWMAQVTLGSGPDTGGIHTAPTLGEAGAVAAQHQLLRLRLVRGFGATLIQALGFGLLGVVALSLTFFDRSDRVYLWIGALLLASSAASGLSILNSWTQWIGSAVSIVALEVFFFPLIMGGWVMVWWVWFRLRRPAWIPRVVPVLVVLLMLSIGLVLSAFSTTFVPMRVGIAFFLFGVAVRVVLVMLLLWIVFQGIRLQGLEGWVALPAVLLATIFGFSRELSFWHIQTHWYPFGISISTQHLANLLLVAALSVLLVRRLVMSVRRQRRMALDVKQAQEVQEVILPEARTVLPGLVVESEYRPALEVGGDFFQIIPHRTDGSLLIVAGDVTGKGLKAGMLVALLVGAIRSTADWSTEPLAVLQALNQRLLGRGDAQATCLAMRIERDGEVTVANAGHVPPYLNGEAVNIEGSLPLGMIQDAESSVARLRLTEGDRLVLMSDGVVEATDATAKLFGFERVHELLKTATSAAEVANAAQKFGQEDDISVILVCRAGELTPAVA